MATLTISIDRTSLSLTPLLFSADDDGTPLGIESFTEPGKVARVKYMPDSDVIHGSEPVGWSWQQGLLSWQTFPTAASESAAASLVAEVVAAVTQFSYEVTVTKGDHSDTWSATVGSVTPAGERTTWDLADHDPSHVVTIPVYPIAS